MKPAASPFHPQHLLFPEYNEAAAFTNDVSILMGFAMNLPAGHCEATDATVQTNADTCILQFIEAFRRARVAHLLDPTNASTMLFVNLAYLMMCKLRGLQECGLLDVRSWCKARNVYRQLCDSLEVGNDIRF